MASRPLAALRLVLLFLWGVFLLLLAPHRAIRQRGFPYRLIRLWHKGSLRIAGVRPTVHGAPVTGRPVLYVANHVSYFDISILGALLDASFVAKAEIAGWPIFGYLARLQRSVFVRRSGRHAAQQRDEIRQRLEAGDQLILFPEGTSSDGARALRFKSALFDAATIEIDGRQVEVQPVSLAYTRFDGMPMGRLLRPFFAWYGDMDLAPHLWRALGLGRIGVDVIFHEPVRLERFGSRKALAQHCEQAVAQGLRDALTGRIEAPARPAPRFKYDKLDLHTASRTS